MPRLFVLIWVFLCPFAHANQLYIHEHERGWYWHDDPVETTEPTTKKTISQHTTPQAANADKTWKLIGKMVAEARAKAILDPSVKNIANARRLQRLMVAQANLFSEKWMLDLLIHPEGDESLVNPSGSNARDLYHQHNSLLKEQVIAQISQTSGLIYFYEANEPFSERMAEVVLDFASHYHMKVLPIAMTSQISSVFPQSRMNAGEAKEMGVKHIPAVFAIHPVSKQAMPVAYGLISQSELKDNIFMISNAFQSGGFDEK